MKIAHCVESYAPSPGGMVEVVKQLSERMVAAGHQVTVFTSYKPERISDTLHGVTIRSYKISGNAVSGIRGETEKYITDLTEGDYDIIVLFAAQQWATDCVLPILDKLKAAKVFVPTGFSMLYHSDWKSHYESMKSWMNQMDMNVFLGEEYRDNHFAKTHGILNRTIIPNGAATEEFDQTDFPSIRSKWHIPGNHRILLHIGSFVTTKGQLDAMKIFYQSGIRNATLLMIGNGAENFWRQLIRKPWLFLTWKWCQLVGSRKVIFTSATRPETIAAYHEADLFLFPSKIECSPIVLFESMASKTPFLVTNVGNSKEIIRWSNGGWLMPGTISADGFTQADIRQSAKLLKDIMHDNNRKEEAAAKGYAAWKNKFTWQIIANSYLELYQKLNKSKG